MTTHRVTTAQETELLEQIGQALWHIQPPARGNTDVKVLDYLHLLDLARAEIDQRIRDTIEDARDGSSLATGALTWAEIGDAIGVTKQGAQQRYGA